MTQNVIMFPFPDAERIRYHVTGKSVASAMLQRVPLVSQSRSLVKRGQLTHLIQQSTGILDKLSRRKELLHVFLFNDLMIITKKKG